MHWIHNCGGRTVEAAVSECYRVDCAVVVDVWNIVIDAVHR